MILNNKKRTINFQLRRFLILFLTVAFIITIYNISYFRTPDTIISRINLTYIVTILYLMYYLVGIIRNYHFFYYTDNGSKLVFRYYSLRPLNKKQNSIEIDKTTLSDYKIEKFLMGFTTKLILKQKLKGKIATYPPVNISLLNGKEIQILNESLKNYIHKVKY